MWWVVWVRGRVWARVWVQVQVQVLIQEPPQMQALILVEVQVRESAVQQCQLQARILVWPGSPALLPLVAWCGRAEGLCCSGVVAGIRMV